MELIYPLLSVVWLLGVCMGSVGGYLLGTYLTTQKNAKELKQMQNMSQYFEHSVLARERFRIAFTQFIRCTDSFLDDIMWLDISCQPPEKQAHYKKMRELTQESEADAEEEDAEDAEE